MDEGLIELGLNEQDSFKPSEVDRVSEATPAAELATFSARLLALVSDTVIESDSLRTYEFRQNSKNTAIVWRTAFMATLMHRRCKRLSPSLRGLSDPCAHVPAGARG